MPSLRQLCLYDSSTNSSEFGEFSSFLDLWRKKSSGTSLPKWSDYDFEDFTDWYGRLSLVEVNAPISLHVILWGTKLTDWFGFDLTKKTLGDNGNPLGADWGKCEEAYFQAMIETRSIGIWKSNLKHMNRDFVSIQGMDLPLAKDGKITHIFSIYSQFKSGEEPVISIEPTHVFQPESSP